MTIQDLGSLGELVAAVATIATLIYLALQIRASTLVSKAEARRATRPSATAIHLAIVGDAEVARIFRTGLADPSKQNPEDWTRFSFLLGELIGNLGEQYREVSAGIMPEEDFDHQVFIMAKFLTTPGGRKFWQQFARTLPSDAREYIQQRVFSDDAQ